MILKALTGSTSITILQEIENNLGENSQFEKFYEVDAGLLGSNDWSVYIVISKFLSYKATVNNPNSTVQTWITSNSSKIYDHRDM